MGFKPFSKQQEELILSAIKQAENTCSGEIRVHIDEYCKGDPLFKAVNIFKHLEMDQTALRNGVLIYVAIEDRKYSIIGDVGIDQQVPDDFWESTKDEMRLFFSQGKIAEGIAKAIDVAGVQLAKFFPPNDNDIDELSDEISYG